MITVFGVSQVDRTISIGSLVSLTFGIRFGWWVRQRLVMIVTSSEANFPLSITLVSITCKVVTVSLTNVSFA